MKNPMKSKAARYKRKIAEHDHSENPRGRIKLIIYETLLWRTTQLRAR